MAGGRWFADGVAAANVATGDNCQIYRLASMGARVDGYNGRDPRLDASIENRAFFMEPSPPADSSNVDS